ncbi:hypothetical protein BH23ACI1_BH23ACI1_10600 [soil metagenome]
MNFLFPVFLLGALAIAIPIALHFLRRDVAPEVPFSAVRLLRTSPIERSRRRRLRDLLLLAARITALLLLAAAFARPYAQGADAPGSDVRIIAVDRSFSMSAPGRFEEALRQAGEALDAAPMSERVAVIAFDDRADVLAPPGGAADARAALARLVPGYGATRYATMLARAVETADGSAGRVVVVTDMQRSGWEDEHRAILPSTLALELRNIGPPVANLAVVDVRVERERVVATVRNAGPPRPGRARVLDQDQEVASAAFTAGADATVLVPIVYRAPASGALTVTVDDPEGPSADNSRHVLLDLASRSSVLIVTPPGTPDAGFFVSRALAAVADDEGAGGEGLQARVVPAPDASAMAAEEFAGHSAVVLLTTRALERRMREGLAALVRGGGGLLIAAAPEVEADVLSAIFDWEPALSAVEQPHQGLTLAATDLRHPIFRPFGPLQANLGHVRFTRTWRVKPDGWDVAARFTDGSAAVLERREGRGRIVLFASDLDRRWNDFPLQPVFVPFVAEAVRHVGVGARAGRDFTVGTVPAGVPAEPGVHRIPPQDRTIVVNVDPRESAITTLTADEFEAMVERVSPEPAEAGEARAREIEARQSLWQYGLLLMLVTLVVESFVGRPR